MTKLLTALLIAIGLSVISTEAQAESTLYAGQYLFAGQALVAPSCYYKLVFQADGNLVLYTRSNAPVWATGTQGSGAGYAVMQGDGNLVLYTWGGRAVWSTGTQAHPFARIAIQDDGNLVVYSGGAALWASGTAGERLGTNVCPASAVTGTENETNRLGGDYMYWDLNSPVPIWCSYFCAQDSRCKAYTYVPPGVQGPKARCWLKNTIPPQSYAPGLMSGVIYH